MILFPQGGWAWLHSSGNLPVLDLRLLETVCQRSAAPSGAQPGPRRPVCWSCFHPPPPPRWSVDAGHCPGRSPPLTGGPPAGPASPHGAIEAQPSGRRSRPPPILSRRSKPVGLFSLTAPPTAVDCAASPSGCSNAWSMPACGRIKQVAMSPNLVDARNRANPFTAFDSGPPGRAGGRRGNGERIGLRQARSDEAFHQPRWLGASPQQREALVGDLCRAQPVALAGLIPAGENSWRTAGPPPNFWLEGRRLRRPSGAGRKRPQRRLRTDAQLRFEKGPAAGR